MQPILAHKIIVTEEKVLGFFYCFLPTTALGTLDCRFRSNTSLMTHELDPLWGKLLPKKKVTCDTKQREAFELLHGEKVKTADSEWRWEMHVCEEFIETDVENAKARVLRRFQDWKDFVADKLVSLVAYRNSILMLLPPKQLISFPGEDFDNRPPILILVNYDYGVDCIYAEITVGLARCRGGVGILQGLRSESRLLGEKLDPCWGSPFLYAPFNDAYRCAQVTLEKSILACGDEQAAVNSVKATVAQKIDEITEILLLNNLQREETPSDQSVRVLNFNPRILPEDKVYKLTDQQ